MAGTGLPVLAQSNNPELARIARRLWDRKVSEVALLGGFHPLEVVARCDVNLPDVLRVRTELAKRAAPDPDIVVDLLRQAPLRIATGIALLDRHLRGGLSSRSITEITGPVASGKSQLCMSVVANTLSRRDTQVLIVDTTGQSVSVRRLTTLVTSDTGQREELEHTLARIRIVRCQTTDGLLRVLEDLNQSLSAHRLDLLVIDSFGDLVVRDFGFQRKLDRHNFILQTTAVLKSLAEKFDAAILVTSSMALATSGRGRQTGSLGNTWSHCVNTRVALECGSRFRIAHVLNSSASPPGSFPFRIVAGGATGVDADS